MSRNDNLVFSLKFTNHTIETFLALLRAGLWEQSVRLLPYEPLDFEALYRLADDQSVVGLLGAGLEHVEDRKVTKPEAVSFLKKVFYYETRNASMNSFIEGVVSKMRNDGIITLLVKGQGIAQCYERPQWRASGDIDFFFDAENYEKAKLFFSQKIKSFEHEGVYNKHLGMTINSWAVELHGTLRCGLSSRIDRVIDSIQDDTFTNENVRAWRNGNTDVFLPGPDNDTIFIFTHFLEHFYKNGIGLRQICDWCRLLWTYRDTIDSQLLERRLQSMGLMSEWRAFAAFAVGALGMPKEAMPLYESSARWRRKARRIQAFVLEVGNFGHNRDMSYYSKYPYVVRKAISFGRRCGDLARHAAIFPLDSVRFFPSIVWNGVRSAARGE